jgi:hypothetical protein
MIRWRVTAGYGGLTGNVAKLTKTSLRVKKNMYNFATAFRRLLFYAGFFQQIHEISFFS